MLYGIDFCNVTVSQRNCKSVVIKSFALSVHVEQIENGTPMSMKSDTGEFCLNLSTRSYFGYNLTSASNSFLKTDVRVCLHLEDNALTMRSEKCFGQRL